jgi:hypothetical protein
VAKAVRAEANISRKRGIGQEFRRFRVDPGLDMA